MLTIVPILLPAVVAAITLLRSVRTTRLAAIFSLTASVLPACSISSASAA